MNATPGPCSILQEPSPCGDLVHDKSFVLVGGGFAIGHDERGCMNRGRGWCSKMNATPDPCSFLRDVEVGTGAGDGGYLEGDVFAGGCLGAAGGVFEAAAAGNLHARYRD